MECMLPVEFLLSSEKEESLLGNELEMNDTTGFYSLGDDLTQFFGGYQQLSTDYPFPEPTIDFQLDDIDSLGLYGANSESKGFNSFDFQPQQQQPLAANFTPDNSLYILEDCMAETQIQQQTNMLGASQSLNSWLSADQFGTLPSYSEVPITTTDRMDFSDLSMFPDLKAPITTTDGNVADFSMFDGSGLPVTTTDSKLLDGADFSMFSDSDLSIAATDNNLIDVADFSMFGDLELSVTATDNKCMDVPDFSMFSDSEAPIIVTESKRSVVADIPVTTTDIKRVDVADFSMFGDLELSVTATDNKCMDVPDFSMFSDSEAPIIVTESKRSVVADIPVTTTDIKRVDVAEFSMFDNLEVPLTTTDKRMDGTDFAMFNDKFVDLPSSIKAPSLVSEKVVDVKSSQVVKEKKTYAKGFPVEIKRLRKKEQNKQAATRYRMKKKAELENLLDEEKLKLEKNKGLRKQREELKTEAKHLKSLMRHVYLAYATTKPSMLYSM